MSIGSKHPNPGESSRSTNRPSSAISNISSRSVKKVNIGITRNVNKKNLEPAITINAYPLYDALVKLNSDREQFEQAIHTKGSFELSDKDIHKINRTKSIENILRLNAKKDPSSASFKVLRIAKKEKEKLHPNRVKPVIVKQESVKFRVPMIDSSSDEEQHDSDIMSHNYKISGIDDLDSYIRNLDIHRDKSLEMLQQHTSDDRKVPITKKLHKKQVEITMPSSPFLHRKNTDISSHAVSARDIEDILQVKKINPSDCDKSHQSEQAHEKPPVSSRRSIIINSKSQSQDRIPTLESDSSDNNTFRVENLHTKPRTQSISHQPQESEPQSENLISLVNIQYGHNQAKLSSPSQKSTIHHESSTNFTQSRPQTSQNRKRVGMVRPQSASNLHQAPRYMSGKPLIFSSSSFSSFTAPFGQPVRGKKVGTTFQFGVMFRPVPLKNPKNAASKQSNLAVMSTTSLKRARWGSAKNRLN